MNYKKVLEKLGFVEGKDFSLIGESFEMLEQSRMINEFINHPAVEATYHDVEISPEVPAVLDEQGIEITPLIPAVFDFQILTPYIAEWNEKVLIHHDAVSAVLDGEGNILVAEIPAYDEEKMIEELFTLAAPSLETLESTWKQVQISEIGITNLINEFLKGKDLLRDSEDSINIVEQSIYTWNFKNIPQPTIDELLALIPTVSLDLQMQSIVNEKGDIGKKLGEDCEKCLNVITGFNDGRLTGVQLQSLLTTFANINTCLSNKMPKSAKGLILQLQPDRIIVTQQMKDVCLYILKDYQLT